MVPRTPRIGELAQTLSRSFLQQLVAPNDLHQSLPLHLSRGRLKWNPLLYNKGLTPKTFPPKAEIPKSIRVVGYTPSDQMISFKPGVRRASAKTRAELFACLRMQVS